MILYFFYNVLRNDAPLTCPLGEWGYTTKILQDRNSPMRIFKSSLKFLVLTAILAVSLPSSSAQAAITELRRLNFGKWFFPNNNTAHSITIALNGNVSTSSSSLIMFSPPVTGLYRVTGLSAFGTVNSVTVTMSQPATFGAGQFLLDNFTTNIPPANNQGTTSLTLGATLTATGNGVGYGPGIYVGDLLIEIDY